MSMGSKSSTSVSSCSMSTWNLMTPASPSDCSDTCCSPSSLTLQMIRMVSPLGIMSLTILCSSPLAMVSTIL